MSENKKASNLYQADCPYPPVRACDKNPRYAQMMLDNLGGQVSEMSAVSLYFYNHLVTNCWKEISGVFHHVSIVEMHHLEIFGTLALQLGQDPRLWSRNRSRYQYWTPAYNKYPPCLDQLLNNAISSEIDARNKYQRQKECIEDENIRENLARIVMDEDLHIEILRSLFQKYCADGE